MTKESSTQEESGSVSYETALVVEKKPIEGAALDSASKLNMTRDPGYTCRSRTGNMAPKLSPYDRKSRTAELVCHLLSFSHARSYEMARFLDMLFLFGQEYAERIAAEREWKIDPVIVAEYRAGVAKIVARYSEVEQSQETASEI